MENKIYRATILNKQHIVPMLFAFFQEIGDANVNTNIKDYEEFYEILVDKGYHIWFTEYSFYIMRNATLPIHNNVLYELLFTYVKPEKRTTRLIVQMRKHMENLYQNCAITTGSQLDGINTRYMLKHHLLVGHQFLWKRSK
jgi:hypothetical protein